MLHFRSHTIHELNPETTVTILIDNRDKAWTLTYTSTGHELLVAPNGRVIDPIDNPTTYQKVADYLAINL